MGTHWHRLKIMFQAIYYYKSFAEIITIAKMRQGEYLIWIAPGFLKVPKFLNLLK